VLLQIPRRAIFENSERNEKEKQFAQKGNNIWMEEISKKFQGNFEIIKMRKR
jgi:hypothetical protein